MKQIVQNIRPHHVFTSVMLGGVVFASSFLAGKSHQSIQPPFSNLDQFVLVAEESIHLAGTTQVSSGDIATNGTLFIAKENIINGSLFADEIHIGESSSINGDASFNALRLANDAEILGATSSPIQLPIIQLPTTPNVTPGNQNIIVTSTTTIAPGNYNSIEVKPNETLTLQPGTYNLNKLFLRDNVTLLFSTTTTVNIKQEFKVSEAVLVAQTTNIPSTALHINYAGNKNITIGENSFISARILAPEARVLLGNRNTFRGQVLAKSIRLGEKAILSREDSFEKESDLARVVQDDNGVKFLVNEIIILFEDGTTVNDAQTIAASFSLQPIGFLPNLLMGKFEAQTETIEDLNNLINQIKNSGNPIIADVLPNILIL